jgi:type IV secretion system protein VirD4
LGGTPIGIPDDRHIMTIAGTRSGKGRSAILPNLITYPGSVLAIDPKGDLARFTADWRREMPGHKVFVLDPFGTAKGLEGRHAAAFNPLTILTEDSKTLLEDAGLISDAIVMAQPDSRDPHWDESARMFLEGVILHVATYDKYIEHRNLVTVYELLMGSSADLKDEMRMNTRADDAVALLADQFYEKADNERSSVLSTLRRHIRFLGYPQMRQVLSGHSFDLRELKTASVTVYLSLPAMRMGTCARWLRLFVNLTLAGLEKERMKPRYPVLMCLDEFATLGPMKTIEDAAGQIAGLGCKLWPILQDLSQLKALYRHRWETFMGNAGILQFFGNSDMMTLNWISQRLGTTMIQTRTRNDTGYHEKATRGATGQTFGESAHSLMTPEEVSRFFGRDDPLLRQLIIQPSLSPMVLQRVYYDKHELFAGYRRYMHDKKYETE